MAEAKLKSPSKRIKKLSKKHIHLKKHFKNFKEKKDTFPEFVEDLESIDESEKQNVVYQITEQVFAHAYCPPEDIKKYYVIQPHLREEEKSLYKDIKKEIMLRSPERPAMVGGEKYEKEMKEILDQITEITNSGKPKKENSSKITSVTGDDYKFILPEKSYNRIWYELKKEIIGLGPLEPLIRDEFNEDIHVLGYDQVNVNHAVYGMMRTDLDLGSPKEYKNWLETITERVGVQASPQNPIIDTTLPDGSRLNIVYSEDVSVEGPTVTIRQFEETPLSIFKIVNYGTMSPELAAYLWLCLESNESIGVCGETASGKTTSMNAMTAFIPRDTKIYTAEDTLEVRPPHEAWQRLLTREARAEGRGIGLFDLITNALRSRPGYIIVGEVRGEEGFNVFQAMQTGHPTVFTFHAGSISSLIDRFTSNPINVPEKFFDNLNLVIFQNFMRLENKDVRRVNEIHEIEGYSKDMGGIVTRQVFDYESSDDKLAFLGKNNSHLLENDVAPSLGFNDSRKVYDVLEERAKVVERAIEEGYTGWKETLSVIRSYQEGGIDELPFYVST